MADTMTESIAVDALDELDDALFGEFYAFTYEDAVLVGPSGSPRNADKPNGRESPTRSPRKQDDQVEVPTASQVAGATATKDELLLPRAMLDAMIPPKAWRDEHGKWQRVARLSLASRADVVRFETLFFQLLDAHQARASAICPVREKLFLQVFEELIRECACECPERGLLLLRLRDELRLSVQAYQTLYHSSIAYGRQKAVQAEAGVAELERRIETLQHEQQALQERHQQLTHRLLHVEAEAAENQELRARCHRQLVAFLTDQRVQLKTFESELTREPTWK